MGADSPATEPRVDLRFSFVEMLFALTVGQIAIEMADLVKNGLHWGSTPAPYTHLILALVLIAASWVEWSRSQAPGNRRDVDSVFSSSFLVLLADVALVVCYFILVRGVEIIPASGQEKAAAKATAEHETLWVMVIFAGYVIWDLLARCWMASPTGQDGVRAAFARLFGTVSWRVGPKDGILFMLRGWASVWCFIAAIVIRRRFGDVVGSWQVAGVDGVLLTLVIFFRALHHGYWKWSAVLGAVLMTMLFFARLG